MGVFDRLRRRGRPGVMRGASDADSDYLEKWATSRRGVEAFVEPRTAVTETTVVLVAGDGEWTRRRVDGEDGARRLGKRLKIPIYDAARVGYPQRMRDYTERQRILRERERREDLGG
ncbi:MAG: oxidoreductase [Pseudonocardiaceae bacterium]